MRHYSDIENAIWTSRFDWNTGKLLLDDKAFFKQLMEEKETSVVNTAWLVSDCDQTNGAARRWKFGQSLIKD